MSKELSWWKIILMPFCLIGAGMPMLVAIRLLMLGEESITLYHNGVLGRAFLGTSLMAIMWFVQIVLIGKEE